MRTVHNNKFIKQFRMVMDNSPTESDISLSLYSDKLHVR